MDNYRVVFTSLAYADLDDIQDYIAADSPARAISLVNVEINIFGSHLTKNFLNHARVF